MKAAGFPPARERRNVDLLHNNNHFELEMVLDRRRQPRRLINRPFRIQLARFKRAAD